MASQVGSLLCPCGRARGLRRSTGSETRHTRWGDRVRLDVTKPKSIAAAVRECTAVNLLIKESERKFHWP